MLLKLRDVMRPCKHTSSQKDCVYCKWCQSPTDKGRAYRQLWNEPEPRSTVRITRERCKYLGEPTGETVACTTCPAAKNMKYKVFACSKHGSCVLNAKQPGVYSCAHCPDYLDSEFVPTGLYPGIYDPLPAPYAPEAMAKPEVQQAYRAALLKLAGSEFAPPLITGRGVLLIGGARYWPMLVLSLRMLRNVNPTIPVQVWHHSAKEPIRYSDLEDLNVELRDFLKVEPALRMPQGWPGKAAALIHCGWEQVFYLDADAYLLRDPKPLMDAMLGHGIAYWSKGGSGIRWDLTGIAGSQRGGVQGGQLIINCRKAWKELVIAHWMNQHSDYWYRHMFGDEDVWQVALAAGSGVGHCIDRARYEHPAWVCSYQDQPLVVHRCCDKLWKEVTPTWWPHLPEESRVFRTLRQYELNNALAVGGL